MRSTTMQAARALGLGFNGDDQLLGEVDGVLVRLWLSDDGARCIAAEVAAQSFDESLTEADVARRGGPAIGLEGCQLHQGWLRVEHAVPTAELSSVIHELTGLAKRLCTWWRAPLVAALQPLGLEASSDRSSFRGRWNASPVEVSESRLADGRWRARVVVPLEPPLPAGTHIRLARSGEQASRLSDVVLDGRLVVAGGPVVHELLAHDAVRGPLLQVLHVHAGAVDEGSIHAFAPSALDTPGVKAALTDACDLARGLTDQRAS